MALRTKKLTPHIGVEVLDIDLTTRPDDATIREIYGLWLDHIMVVFRGQSLDQESLLQVTSYFGTPGANARPKEYRTSGQHDMLPGIMLISNIRANGEPIGALPDGDMMFHHDMIHADVPDKATCLYAVEIPSEGGNTLFASGYAAYETLDSGLRDSLEGKRAFHHYNYGSQHRGDDIGTPAFSEAEHPVFRTHPETGRKAIYVDRLITASIVGMAETESESVLTRLFDHSEKDEFVYEHEWRKGDMLLWDNRCSMHARRDFPSSERRLLWRTTVSSDEPPV